MSESEVKNQSPADGGENQGGDDNSGKKEEEEVEVKPEPKTDPSKDLWGNIALNVKEALLESTDQTALFVGAKHCGKTSLIYRMLGMSQAAKPSTALEYYYGKREERNATQVAHFWELAHGQDLSQLSEIVINGENIHASVAVIVVDCADVATMWETCEFWLRKLDQRAGEIFQKMRSKNSSTPDKMLARLKSRIGESHPDLEQMRLSGLPFCIIGNRLDMFKEDTVKGKTMVRTLRYLAHFYGACLCLTSDREIEAAKYRALMSHLIFGVPFDTKFANLDHEKGGLLITAGMDSFRDIGDPAPVQLKGFVPCGDSTLDRWKAPFDDAFPPRNEGGRVGDAAEADAFTKMLYDVESGGGEPTVDACRRQMDEELELYRKQASTKDREDGGDREGGKKRRKDRGG